ncbi:plectin-like isoform X2 [Amphibalanus amphitrite]|uniref:plectin-like isoform X2 n=1 Tax=Amphibalanus amphitrite TaxID=1232801 RepID=UPI001C90C4EE|nr:plectin-like isoform X2 [Amphibalanus amphitrite]
MSPPPAGPWVPPPARATRAPLTVNMLSPLKLRISEMEALASLMADSGLSAAGDTSPESRRSGDAPGARVRHAQPRPVRGRRRTNKASGSQRSRRAGLADDYAPVIRRPDRDVAPPSAEAAQVAPPSAARRPVHACSGQSASTSERLEPPPPPPPPPPERDADHGPTGLPGTFTTDSQLPPTELVPPLSELLPEAGASLHEVLEKFLWAKQQASAAANLMSSLRQAVERMDQDSPRQTLAAVAARSAPGHDPAPPAPTTSEPACRPLPETGVAAPRPTVTQTVSQTVSQAVTQAVTHSSLLATSCSLTGAPWPGSVTPLSAGSEGSASSAESVSVMPEESRSQLLPTATESRDSRRGAATGQGSELDWRSVSASDTAPGRGGPPPAAAPASQLRQVEALRRRYQRQQDKLRRLEQTNYVLNLAVDGQDKTIRTLSTQLEDTKEALLQEISQQPTPAPAAGRGDATQTGPSLVTLRAAREDGTQTAPDGGVEEGDPPPPRVDSPGPPPGSGQAENKKTTSVACGDGGGLESAIAMVDSRRPTLVETATSPVSEPDPEPQPERQPEPGTGHIQREASRTRSERDETTDERSEREVRRLLAALDAKERELASLRAERLGATPDRYLPDQAFISTPVSGVTRAAQPQPVSEWPGVPGVGPLSAEGGRRPAAAAPRAWSSEAVRQWAPPADGRTHRRHSFTAPAQREGALWRPLAAEPVRVQRSLLPEFEQVDVAAGTRPAAAPHQEYDDECERLQEALNKGRSKIIQLEEEIFELKCARRRHGSGELEKAAAATAELKQQLARSVQERQQLQGQLTAAETAGTELRQQLQKLREEVQSKDTQLARTSQHLEERVAQVSSLSRELEAAREEAVRQERAAAVRQDDLLTRVTQLEQTADALRLENKRLGQARDEAGHLAASERRLRQRVTELQERLDQSNNTAKMLENYIHFLKSSYNSMFGAPTAAGGSPGVGSLASSDGHGAARGLFHLSGK